ncbi:hypothetical protein LCGC14_2095070 [marine sediment metagenome]|uniref:Helix-turn-helix domain-containing protein n=1 Tax=marine sediment metagenome TaxID=412755 RepID=A0A0F9H8D5_9ZZZZ
MNSFGRPYQKDDSHYITNQAAQDLTGLSYMCLIYHLRKGNIRGRRFTNGQSGRLTLHLNIEDVLICSYPTLTDIVKRTGVKRQNLYYLIRNWSLPGLCRFGKKYRIEPEYLMAWINLSA